MKFNNVPNKSYNIDGKIIWDSRSVAVSGVILAWKIGDELPYVLTSTRGPNSADFQGMENLVCGYIDRNESATESMIRETWEETGLNLVEIMESDVECINNLEQPWFVASEPTQNLQNVTLRYGLCFAVDVDKEFPVLTTEHNEVVGEVENPRWLRIDEIDNFEWAFGHCDLIKKYMAFIMNHHND